MAAVRLGDVNDNAPVITSNGRCQAAHVAENTTAVTTVTSTDADAVAPAPSSLSGGADMALFSINSATGALSFISAPNYEAPTDANADGPRHRTAPTPTAPGLAVTVTNVIDADGHQQRHRIRGRDHRRQGRVTASDPTLLRHLHTPMLRQPTRPSSHQRHRRPDLCHGA